MGASSFRLEHGSEAQGFGQRIVDDHGVIALVKARGKSVGAGPVLAAAPELLAALKWFIDDIDGTHTVMLDFDRNVERARAALRKAEGR
jgi:hypothetical protein